MFILDICYFLVYVLYAHKNVDNYGWCLSLEKTALCPWIIIVYHKMCVTLPSSPVLDLFAAWDLLVKYDNGLLYPICVGLLKININWLHMPVIFTLISYYVKWNHLNWIPKCKLLMLVVQPFNGIQYPDLCVGFCWTFNFCAGCRYFYISFVLLLKYQHNLNFWYHLILSLKVFILLSLYVR